jgi:hypothetical protein
MAYEVRVLGTILQNNIPISSGIAVQLCQIIEVDNIKGIRNTIISYSSSTDGVGNVLFSGVSAGEYDITVDGKTRLMGYVVKNEVPVVQGDTSAIIESRNYIRSQESIVGAGVLFSNEPKRDIHLGYPNDDVIESGVSLGSVVRTFVNRNDDSAFSETIYLTKETDVYYNGNQSTKLTQNFIINMI